MCTGKLRERVAEARSRNGTPAGRGELRTREWWDRLAGRQVYDTRELRGAEMVNGGQGMEDGYDEEREPRSGEEMACHLASLVRRL